MEKLVCIVREKETGLYWLLEKSKVFMLINRKGITSKSKELGEITESVNLITEGAALTYDIPFGFDSKKFSPLTPKEKREARCNLGIVT